MHRRIPQAAAVPALVTALKEGQPILRRNAAEALGRIGAAAKVAVPVLEAALKDEDMNVQDAAGDALKVLDPEAARRAGVS